MRAIFAIALAQRESCWESPGLLPVRKLAMVSGLRGQLRELFRSLNIGIAVLGF